MDQAFTATRNRAVLHDEGGDFPLQKIAPLFASKLPALANIVIGGLVVLAVSESVSWIYLAIWMLAMAAVSLYRIDLITRFGKAQVTPRDAGYWESRMFYCVTLQGVLWGLSGVAIALCPMSTKEVVVICLAGLGMLAGATLTLPGSQRAFRAFVILGGVGPSVGMMFQEEAGGIFVTLMGLMYISVILIWGHTVARSTDERLALAAEKEHLLANLEIAHRETELEKGFKQETYNKLGHELRTPLNSIIGFAEVMGAEALGPIGNEKYKEYAALIYESGRHLSALIDEMLTLARSDNVTNMLEEAPVDVAALLNFCRDLLAPYAKKRGVELSVLPSERSIPRISGDLLKLRQVFINLINNAIHYTLPGGSIELSLKSLPDDKVEILVADTGIGMAQEDIPKALEPFSQLENGERYNPKGKGIGLALSKKLIEQHGGELGVESALGAGTTIRISLPAAADN